MFLAKFKCKCFHIGKFITPIMDVILCIYLLTLKASNSSLAELDEDALFLNDETAVCLGENASEEFCFFANPTRKQIYKAGMTIQQTQIPAPKPPAMTRSRTRISLRLPWFFGSDKSEKESTATNAKKTQNSNFLRMQSQRAHQSKVIVANPFDLTAIVAKKTSEAKKTHLEPSRHNFLASTRSDIPRYQSKPKPEDASKLPNSPYNNYVFQRAKSNLEFRRTQRSGNVRKSYIAQ